jgi:hypothetical protein
MEARARILVLTEDSGRQAQSTLQKLLKEALKLVVVGVDLNPARVRLEPLPEREPARLAVRANKWEEHPPPRETILLLGAIAAQLRQPAGFVAFHFDTDRVWSERHKSKRQEKFEAIIRDGVRRILRGEAPLPFPQRPPPTLTAEEIETALRRLIVLSPCYSIESWLYQATNALRAYCQAGHTPEEHSRREEHLKLIESWSMDRTLLDEVSRPKDDVMQCVADHHNEELAKVFPAEEVWLAERSFYESVERLRACPTLVEALGS